MKLLTDQDVYATTARFLISGGHDVVTASQLGMAQVADIELLRIAKEQARILITRDRDFGNLVFVEGMQAGVIYLRVSPSLQDAVHLELHRVLSSYSEDTLRSAFIAVEPGRHRFRRLSR